MKYSIILKKSNDLIILMLFLQKASPIYSLAAGTCLSADKPSVNSYVVMEICSSVHNSHWDFIPTYSR